MWFWGLSVGGANSQSGGVSSPEKSSAPSAPIQHARVSGDLVGVLTSTAKTFHVPIVAELAQPYPLSLDVPAGSDTLTAYMDLVVKQSPGYSWQNANGAVWIYNRKLLMARADFLERRIEKFMMPRNFAELKKLLPVYISVAEGRGGGVTAGGGTPEEERISLSPEVIRDATVREILFHVAKQTPELFSLVIFPNDNPQPKDEPEAFATWRLVTVSSLTLNPLHMKSYPVPAQSGRKKVR